MNRPSHQPPMLRPKLRRNLRKQSHVANRHRAVDDAAMWQAKRVARSTVPTTYPASSLQPTRDQADVKNRPTLLTPIPNFRSVNSHLCSECHRHTDQRLSKVL